MTLRCLHCDAKFSKDNLREIYKSRFIDGGGSDVHRDVAERAFEELNSRSPYLSCPNCDDSDGVLIESRLVSSVDRLRDRLDVDAVSRKESGGMDLK